MRVMLTEGLPEPARVTLNKLRMSYRSARSITSTSYLFFNSKELSILLQFVNLTCFSYF